MTTDGYLNFYRVALDLDRFERPVVVFDESGRALVCEFSDVSRRDFSLDYIYENLSDRDCPCCFEDSLSSANGGSED